MAAKREYLIIAGDNPVDLSLRVEEHMENGYIPLGRPFVVQQHGTFGDTVATEWYQAMQKCEIVLLGNLT